ncbi:BTB/POZ and MATH domain-containing protein 1-like [Triticum aestivum]|uniref:BTB/POZ and MATH domain-containing protein 1-like n=1 Tax=Triticum aestivum TaxID=4565 RepID=UPI001D008C3E|nr:BTB/POZ and MATH domain-containing protein 1-like [Triticum aestivum]
MASQPPPRAQEDDLGRYLHSPPASDAGAVLGEKATVSLAPTLSPAMASQTPPQAQEGDLEGFVPSSPSSSSASGADSEHRRAVDDLLVLYSSDSDDQLLLLYSSDSDDQLLLLYSSDSDDEPTRTASTTPPPPKPSPSPLPLPSPSPMRLTAASASIEKLLDGSEAILSTGNTEVEVAGVIEETRSEVHFLKIDGYRTIRELLYCSDYWIESRWKVGGFEWGVEINVSTFVEFRLIFLSQGCSTTNVEATLSCRLVDPRGIAEPSEQKCSSGTFNRHPNGPPRWAGDWSKLRFILVSSQELEASAYLKDDSFTVECTLSVLNIAQPADLSSSVPDSLGQHLAELLQSGMEADVEFVVAGQSFLAHKDIVAARSPVFMAAFFGQMREANSRTVVIEDMEAAAFEAMMHFIYTDTVPELDSQDEAATTMAQHLLVAGDRYGMDRLKLLCENKLFSCITAENARTTLALAEQHNCRRLRAKIQLMLRTLPR